MNVSCADIYRLMLSDKKYGLSVNLMATRVMPSLLPQTVNPSLNLEQFTNLLEVLQEMLDHIDRYVAVATTVRIVRSTDRQIDRSIYQDLRHDTWVSAIGEGPFLDHINPLALELDIYSLAHHLCEL